MSVIVHGLELSGRFYQSLVRPILDAEFPAQLRGAAQVRALCHIRVISEAKPCLVRAMRHRLPAWQVQRDTTGGQIREAKGRIVPVFGRARVDQRSTGPWAWGFPGVAFGARQAADRSPSSSFLIEQAQQEAAIRRRPEQITELIDRAGRPPFGDAEHGRILDLGLQEAREVGPRDLERPVP